MSIVEGEPFDLIVVGPLSVDDICLGAKEWVQLGGTAAYTSLMAAKLSVRVGIVSTAGPEAREEERLRILNENGVKTCVIDTEETLRFTNSYSGEGRRIQHVEGATREIGYKDIIQCGFLKSQWFHFGPLLNDVAFDAIREVDKRRARISLDPQGYLRRRQSNGLKVEAGDWPESDEILRLVHVLKLNLKEAMQVTGKHDPRQIAEALYDKGPKGPHIVLITMGRDGSVLYSDRGFNEIPPREPIDLKDPTGAGDVYAGAFLAEYMRTSDAEESAWFASVASSLAVEEIGFKGIQGKKRVKRALDELRSQTGSIKRGSGTSTQRG